MKSIQRQIEANLRLYLETETLLNAFFAAFDYCPSRCIRVEMEKNGNRPVAACCTKKYYVLYDVDHPAYARLRQEREKRFGRPQDHRWLNPVSACEYHNPARGCVLSTHKSPICIAFLCRQAIDCLRDDFGVYAYDYLGVYYALEWILTGNLPEGQYRQFRQDILHMTAAVNPEIRGPRLHPHGSGILE